MVEGEGSCYSTQNKFLAREQKIVEFHLLITILNENRLISPRAFLMSDSKILQEGIPLTICGPKAAAAKKGGDLLRLQRVQSKIVNGQREREQV